MIIVKLMGGLGNQMFQYAFGKALSLERKEEVIYDTSFYLDKNILADELKSGLCRRLSLYHFNINLKEKPSGSRFKRYWGRCVNNIHSRVPILSKITKSVIFDESYPILDLSYHPEVWKINADKIIFIGYWQSEKYFIKYSNDILHDFQILTPQSEKNKDMSEQITNCNSVSLHLRRGDYSPDIILDVGYYSRAIEYIAKHVDNPVFFIFSDDIQWAKDNIKIPFEVHYMEQNSQAEAYEDMRLISQCKHNITANSSFSWWGAWLNQNSDKIIIAPQNWRIPGCNPSDIVPESWVKL